MAILGIPLNTPPRKVNGKFILGGPYADPDSYTYPQNLKEILEDQFNYKLHPTTDPASADEPTSPDVVEDLEAMIHQRFDVAEWMLKDDPDLLNITLFYINHLQHMAWKSPEVKHLWEVIDQRLKQLLGQEDNIIIHSDHGLHEVTRVFYLNSWLESQGHLKLEERKKGYRWKVLNIAEKAADRLANQPLLKKHLPTNVIDNLSVSTSGRIVDASEYESRIDFEESTAVGLPHGLIYVLDDDRTSTLKNLQKNLQQITLPESSKKAFKEIELLEQEYTNWDTNKSPDLFCRWNTGVEIKDVNADNPSRQFGPPQKFKADNDFYGILVASGPKIGNSEIQQGVRLYDLAPSLLHLLGHPIPSDMDGQVIRDLYATDTDPYTREIKEMAGETVETVVREDKDQVEDRLKDLGYLE